MDFHVTGATCYLTAKLFYLEVVLLPCGGVESVKLAPHAGSPIVCKSTVNAPKSSAQVIIRDSVAAQRVAPAAAQVGSLRSAISNGRDRRFYVPQRARNFSKFSVRLTDLFHQYNIPGEKYQHPSSFKAFTYWSIFQSPMRLSLISVRSSSNCLSLYSTLHRTCSACPICPGEVMIRSNWSGFIYVFLIL